MIARGAALEFQLPVNSIVFAASLLLAATPQSEVEQLRKQVMEAELAVYRQAAHFRPCGEDAVALGGRPSPLGLQKFHLAAKGDFYDVTRRLHRTALDPNRDFETLRIKAVDGGNVTLEATVVEACWDSGWTRPRVQPVPVGDPVALEKKLYRDRLEDLQAISAQAAELTARMQPMKIVSAIAAVTNAWSERPIRLSELQLAAGGLTLRGLAVGKAAAGSIDPALRKAGFDGGKVEWSALADCRAFTAVARLSAMKANEDTTPYDLFDERTSALCNAKAAVAAKPIAAKGTGKLTVRARDIDAATLFLLLNELDPAQGFLVEPGVTARVDADFDRVTLENVFTALRENGVANVGPGAFHRVCKAECAPLREQKWEGEPISMLLSGADVLDVFRVLHDVTGLEIRARSLTGTVSIYARDVEWDRIFAALVAAAGKTYTIEGATVRLDREDAVPIDTLVASPGGTRGTLIERDPKNIAVEDLRLAAIVSDGESAMAWARVPGSAKLLFRLEPGLALYDGTVESIAADKVVVRAGNGRQIPLSLR